MQTTEYKSGSGKQLRLHEFKAITEGVMYVKAVSLESVIFNDLDLLGLQPRAERHHIQDANGRMRLGCGSEVHLHADMYLMHAALQPETSAGLQSGRFGE